MLLKPVIKKKRKESANMRLATFLLLNRILQTEKSVSRKTLKEIAEKTSVSVSKVMIAEKYITEILREKIAVIKVLINVK